MSYDDLSVRINSGDKAALREFLSDAGREIYDIAVAELKDKDKAMEVTRAVFSRIHDSAKSGDCSLELSGWVVRLTLEQCIIAQDLPTDLPTGQQADAEPMEEDAAAEQEHEPIKAETACEEVHEIGDAGDAAVDTCALSDNSIPSAENKKKKSRKKTIVHVRDITLIVILSILTLFMAWTVFVMLITNRFISDITQGIAYDYAAWFNENIFRLY